MITLIANFAKIAGTACDPGSSSSFFGFPHWYEYLPGVWTAINPTNPKSQLVCSPRLDDLTNAWLIVAAIIEILLRIAALVAVAFVIYGGINYVTSQGEPDATGRAKNTLVNALVGLAVSVMAAAIVAFIAGNIK